MYAEHMARLARERGDENSAKYWDYVKAVVDGCPPLSDEQRSALAVLLRPVRLTERAVQGGGSG